MSVTVSRCPVSRRVCAAPSGPMDPRCRRWLQGSPRPCRLLLHALCSGPGGAMAALRLLQRGQPGEGPGQAFPWQALSAALCAEEPALEGPHDTLAVKPRLLLLPVVCQRNLLSLLLVVRDVVPGDCLVQLLQAVEKDSHVDPWVRALGHLLRQGHRAQGEFPPPTPLSAACQQQLSGLCQKIAQKKAEEGQRKSNWCFSKQPDAADSVPQGGKRKKASEESVEQDSGREGKRMLLEEVPCCHLLWSGILLSLGDALELPSIPTAATAGVLPLSLMSPPLWHPQLEGLCSFLQLSTCPEPFLVRFCSWLLPLTPELSYTSAAILAEQLFLRRVLSLTQPPSRHLMAALTSFCSKYSHPLCRVLLAAVLQEPGEGVLGSGSWRGAPAAGCCVLGGDLWSSPVPLLDVFQEELPAELLDLLVLTLCRQGSAFAASLGYARLVTAVLTGYQNQVSEPGSILQLLLSHQPGLQPSWGLGWVPGRAAP
uniref:FA complementation group E n=1 Tax=Malurus cyaneus samueli TaxID=2593467 RepID=A0A8C5WZU2_9PASS